MTSPARQVSFDDEMLLLVDAADNVVGHASKLDCHTGDGVLHRAFSVFLFNADGQLLLQRRSRHKRLWPLYWSNTCCSHPRQGESLDHAVARRMTEELGLSPRVRFLYRFEYRARFGDVGSEHELCSVYVGRTVQAPRVNDTEIAEWRYLDADELDRELTADPPEGGRYTPWLKLEWRTLRTDYRDALATLT